ncbi:D-alanyl-D-alanine carboxypeptidase/D-alanyl-D-alanine-endopeptidase [Persicimonas caeni]|uniref:D-alanyl-D-alanine carboxypeptidase/D-alanyl-D-alanine-endopeptidase n=1 Tax=Persicimonas caeni TaxID=2292766 RepID=A0A4Y6PRH5_PERCE|nr:D-alanyl-D-alanine carboxypeptidase/D-alanyl-D-alanine-endopeptidase [Persicimonas caeni]QDG50942.1 D-alanyl-D-alanine carboxypeptidase/D-alanyl-D-alanine-endopeptidase [Persicimonas caeni]QED32163.1 D-alanyl-D-alanine carboxypeptidase/D-alanyl-D-alanine-endopeptidase [Persicimonas caeni]
MTKSLFRVLTLALVLGLATPLAAQESPTAKAETAEAQVGQPPQAQQQADPAFDREATKLAGQIKAILAGSDVTAGKVGIHAVDVATGQVLHSQGADEPMNPASNMKLITSAAALDKFGPQYTFGTKLMAKEVDDGTIKGSLYVKGNGEAFLLHEDVLDWAGQLRQKGIEKIEGDIVIDDTAFNAAYLPPGFEQKNEDASYRSPIGAVSVNFNAVTAIVEPAGKAGEKPEVRMYPPNEHVEIVNQATTYEGRRRRIGVKSVPTEEGTKLVITGKIGTQASPYRSRRKRIDNPPAFAGSVLANSLEMVGIAFDGEVKTGQAPDGADVVVSHNSQPLSYVVLAMNKWSNNFMAEQVMRTLGGDDQTASTWDAARQEATAFLKKAGIDTSTVTIHNGSGLYDGNLVSPKQFVQLLRYMSSHKWAPEYMTSLAVAGVDGTLERRMTGEQTTANVRGKTGTLNEVSALSGYLRTESGRLVAFSVLFNDPPKRAWRYRPVQDRIVEAIAGFDE